MFILVLEEFSFLTEIKKLSKQKIRESEKSNVSEYEKYGLRSGGLKKKMF